MYAEKFDETLEWAVIKIQQKIDVRYDEALLLGHCIAHTYFEIKGDAALLAERFNLSEVELAALTRDKDFYHKINEQDSEHRYIMAFGE